MGAVRRESTNSLGRPVNSALNMEPNLESGLGLPNRQDPGLELVPCANGA